jgi:hypothetical protein
MIFLQHVSTGAYYNLLVALEQFFPEGGHIPHLVLLLKDQNFIKWISFLFIDETHFIIIGRIKISTVLFMVQTKELALLTSTIPYGHFMTHHYFVIFNYRPQIYTTYLATSLNTFNIFPYPTPSEMKQFHKEMIEIVFSM